MEWKSLLGYMSAVLYLTCTTVAGQNETIDATLTPTVLYTPGYADGAYEPNMEYTYLVSTNLTNHTVLATVTDCELEGQFIKKVFCNDYGSVYDGSTISATKLGDFCCLNGSSLPEYQSSGESLYIVFTSDEDTQNRGFSMTVQADDPTATTTTTTTTQSTTQTTTQSTSAVAQTQASTEDSKNYTWIIVGSVIGGVNLIIIIVIIFVCFVKKADSAKTPGGSHVTSRVLWSRANTMVEPISTKDVPPGEVVQTNIFDMDLPAGDGKANQLPPLRQSLSAGKRENSFILT